MGTYAVTADIPVQKPVANIVA